MESIYILLIILIILIIYLIILIKKSINKDDLYDVLNENNRIIGGGILDFKEKIIEKLYEGFKSSNNDVNIIGEKVETRLREGLKDSNAIINGILEKLGQMDRTQKNIEDLSKKIEEFQNILSNKNTRGIFGETQLYQVLDYIYGDSSLYEKQVVLSNSKRADAIINISSKNRKLAIDSKFPLDNYKKYLAQNNRETRKEFILGVRKQIDDISSKYIIPGETLEQAIMFIPSEAIYIDIYSNFEEDILNYAISKNVWIVSKYSLMLYVSTIKVAELEYSRNRNAEEILKSLIKLSSEFERFSNRWEKLDKDFDKIYKDFKEVSTTTNKINREFDIIKNKK